MPEPLTADDVAALRAADQVTFSHYEGSATIRAYFRGNRPATARIWTLFPTPEHGTERSRTVNTGASVRGYNNSGESMAMWTATEEDHAVTCFYFLYSAQLTETWTTIASLLRAGDTLTLLWVADNNSAHIREAGLHSDLLELRATSAKGVTRTFNVGAQVSPDNSARMIRRHTELWARATESVPTA
jgi:hypothetical protein